MITLIFIMKKTFLKCCQRKAQKQQLQMLMGMGLMISILVERKDHPGQIYLQTRDGKFIKKKEPAFDQFKDFEDEAVLFFDADNDGDEDLYVGPGGNEDPSYSRPMQSRLYKNDGKGKFHN